MIATITTSSTIERTITATLITFLDRSSLVFSFVIHSSKFSLGCGQYHRAVAGGYAVKFQSSKRFGPTRYRAVVLTVSKFVPVLPPRDLMLARNSKTEVPQRQKPKRPIPRTPVASLPTRTQVWTSPCLPGSATPRRFRLATARLDSTKLLPPCSPATGCLLNPAID